MNASVIVAFVKDQLLELGYMAKVMDDDDAVGSAASGLKFYIQAYDSSIQFRCLLSLEPEITDWLAFCNTFNRKMRFIKIYLDAEDASLLAEADWWLDTEGLDLARQFKQAMDFWEVSLATLKDELRGQVSAKTPAEL